MDFELDLGRKFCPVRVVRHRLSRGDVAALSLQVSKARLAGIWSNQACERCPWLWQEAGTR